MVIEIGTLYFIYYYMTDFQLKTLKQIKFKTRNARGKLTGEAYTCMYFLVFRQMDL